MYIVKKKVVFNFGLPHSMKNVQKAVGRAEKNLGQRAGRAFHTFMTRGPSGVLQPGSEPQPRANNISSP